jgi:hypothetical protein
MGGRGREEVVGCIGEWGKWERQRGRGSAAKRIGGGGCKGSGGDYG